MRRPYSFRALQISFVPSNMTSSKMGAIVSPSHPVPNRFSRSAYRAASARNPDRLFATLSIADISPSSRVILIRTALPVRSVAPKEVQRYRSGKNTEKPPVVHPHPTSPNPLDKASYPSPLREKVIKGLFYRTGEPLASSLVVAAAGSYLYQHGAGRGFGGVDDGADINRCVLVDFSCSVIGSLVIKAIVI